MLPPKVAIIIVNWNSFYHTNNCINSLKKINYKDFDIIVVDNGSEDNSGKALKETHPEIILLQSPVNTGFAGGNDIALKYSIEKKYTYSLLLNNDTFVEPDFLDELPAYMDEHENVGACQPKIFYHSQPHILWNGGSVYNRFLGITYSRRYLRKEGKWQKSIHEVDWITGCAFFVRNSILQETGLLSNNMFMYYEDVEFSMRIKRKGYQLMFFPGSVVYHIAGASLKEKKRGKEGYLNPRVHYFNFRNNIWFLKKYTPLYFAPTVVLFNLFYYGAFLCYFLIRGRFKKFKAVLMAIKDGLIYKITY